MRGGPNRVELDDAVRGDDQVSSGLNTRLEHSS